MAQRAGDVEDVVARLDRVVDRARADNSRIGYFAVLYRLTTQALLAAMESGRFEDPARLAAFTATFAGRYLDALDRPPALASCWDVAFKATETWRPVVVQHLLLGMNAHINYDLGIAAATTAPGVELPRLRRDFDSVNDVLESLIDRIDEALARIWPTMRLLDTLGGRTDEAIINFSIRRARAAAWSAAERLAPLDPTAQQAELRRTDGATSSLARKILTPGIKLTLALLVVRLQERGSVSSIVDRLEHAPEVNQLMASLRSGT